MPNASSLHAFLTADTWLWPAAVWTLLILGGWLLLFALFWDRPGVLGRPAERCKCCRYDLTRTTGEIVRCPECGATHWSRRELRKVRRKWVVAWVGVVVFAAAWAGHRRRELSWFGEIALLPPPVLLLTRSPLELLNQGPDRDGWWEYSASFGLPEHTATQVPEWLQSRWLERLDGSRSHVKVDTDDYWLTYDTKGLFGTSRFDPSLYERDLGGPLGQDDPWMHGWGFFYRMKNVAEPLQTELVDVLHVEEVTMQLDGSIRAIAREQSEQSTTPPMISVLGTLAIGQSEGGHETTERFLDWLLKDRPWPESSDDAFEILPEIEYRILSFSADLAVTNRVRDTIHCSGFSTLVSYSARRAAERGLVAEARGRWPYERLAWVVGGKLLVGTTPDLAPDLIAFMNHIRNTGEIPGEDWVPPSGRGNADD
ncbi:MAG: hypothetical protein AAGI17_01660 [Planctomycetota bacterium]